MSDLTNIARQISEARRLRGLTQSELARQVECKQSAVSMLERGHENALARPKVEAILKLLEIEPETLRASAPPAPRGHQSYCPQPDCPSNIPLFVNARLLFCPQPPGDMQDGQKYCSYCGELLEKQCPECGQTANRGTCCIHCGAAYITTSPDSANRNAADWILERNFRLQLITHDALENA